MCQIKTTKPRSKDKTMEPDLTDTLVSDLMKKAVRFVNDVCRTVGTGRVRVEQSDAMDRYRCCAVRRLGAICACPSFVASTCCMVL